MNIKKRFRLNTKEIRYILNTKNKKFIRWKILNINMIEQFPNQKYNKFAISISSKFSKKAIYRNIFRRYFFHAIFQNNFVCSKIQNSYKKIFVSFKKDISWELSQEQIKLYIQQDLKKFL